MATDPNKAVYNSTTEKAMLSARKTSNTFGVIFLIIAGLSFLALIFDAPDELWAVLGSAVVMGVLFLLTGTFFRWLARASVAMETYIYNDALNKAEKAEREKVELAEKGTE